MVELDFTADAHLQIGALIAEKYRVERTLGTGGMGSVLEASHVSLGHRVALKILHPEALGDGDALARFFREARATALLESEHVVKIHDLGTTREGMPFLVMERLIGFDLGDLLSRIGPLPTGLAVECVYQGTLGVREAHAAGVVHRDLKPSNLFLSRQGDGSPLVKVLDFGISKVESEDKNVRLTQTRSIVGSPLYMSPEQVRDARSASVRSDIWALGAILHEILTGEPTFSGDTLPSVCVSIVSDEPRPITREDVSPALRAIIDTCLRKDPQDRYQTVDELIEALKPIRRSHPVESLDELSVTFPIRSSRESLAADTSGHFSPAMHSMPTISESIEPAVSQTSSGVRPRNAQSTLNSTQLSDYSKKRASPRQDRLAPLLLGALTLALLGSIFWIFVSRSSSDRIPDAQTVSTGSKLELTTEPAGALVTERGRVLGTTPVSLALDLSKQRTRELELSLEGYRPHLLSLNADDLKKPLRVELIKKSASTPHSVEQDSAPVHPQPLGNPTEVSTPPAPSAATQAARPASAEPKPQLKPRPTIKPQPQPSTQVPTQPESKQSEPPTEPDIRLER